jgi:transcriptional regulator with XRE-family HTH domain
VKDRISYIVEQSGLTKTAFGKRINVSQGLVSQMCNGTTKPSERTIQDICREFGVNEVWLRTGEGEPFRESTQEEEIMRFAVRTCKGSDDFIKAYVAMLANLSPEGWKGLREQYEMQFNLLAKMNKKE